MVNPVDRIRADRADARKLDDPNADICHLALADRNGKASVRTLVLRSINDNRFGVFINKTSPKWAILSNDCDYELLVWYPSMQRQYRISGSVEFLDDDIVKTNWHRRPLGSKYLDYVYGQLGPQSSFIESRATLLEAVKQIKETWRGKDMEPPDTVAGVELVAECIEVLDLNREERIHDRQLYTLVKGTWTSRVLVP
ncbi:MAG: pyridoxamine 5'-phosphate oxidase family protein [Pseudomonadales bacterium]